MGTNDERFYVLTTNGDRGPLDRNEIKAMLQRRELQSGDQLRNAFGRSVGTVAEVLADRRKSTQAAGPQTAPQRPQRSAPAGLPPYAAVAIGAGLLVVIVAVLFLRPAAPAVPVPESTPAPAPVPAPAAQTAPKPAPVISRSPLPGVVWTAEDIGVMISGRGPKLAELPWVIEAAGDDIWATADSFRFVWAPLPADGSISVCLTAVDGARHQFGKCGVMLRASRDPGAAYVTCDVSPATNPETIFRTAAGESSNTEQQEVPFGLPVWMRLVRHGGVIAAWLSHDGAEWKRYGNEQRIPELATGEIMAGVVVCSHIHDAATIATFDHPTLVRE